jgi:hypothetical protein
VFFAYSDQVRRRACEDKQLTEESSQNRFTVLFRAPFFHFITPLPVNIQTPDEKKNTSSIVSSHFLDSFLTQPRPTNRYHFNPGVAASKQASKQATIATIFSYCFHNLDLPASCIFFFVVVVVVVAPFWCLCVVLSLSQNVANGDRFTFFWERSSSFTIPIFPPNSNFNIVTDHSIVMVVTDSVTSIRILLYSCR